MLTYQQAVPLVRCHSTSSPEDPRSCSLGDNRWQTAYQPRVIYIVFWFMIQVVTALEGVCAYDIRALFCSKTFTPHSSQLYVLNCSSCKLSLQLGKIINLFLVNMMDPDSCGTRDLSRNDILNSKAIWPSMKSLSDRSSSSLSSDTAKLTRGGEANEPFDVERGKRCYSTIHRVHPNLSIADRPIHTLACPYVKYDPMKYGSIKSCMGPNARGWRNINRLK